MRTRLPVRLLELFLSRKAGARAISRMFRHIRPIETAIYGTDFAIHGMSPHKKTPLFLPYSGKKTLFPAETLRGVGRRCLIVSCSCFLRIRVP